MLAFFEGLPSTDKKFAIKSGITHASIISIHCSDVKLKFRHTWASLMRQSGEGLDKIQELGGWQDPKMVRRYAHLSTDHLAKASSAIDRVFEMPDQGKLVSYGGR